MNYDRIDELLSELHMSRRQLAIKAGIKPSTMSMWFCRKTLHVPLHNIQAIAGVLGVPYWQITIIDENVDMKAFVNEIIHYHVSDYVQRDFLPDFYKLSLASQCRVISYIYELLEKESNSTQNKSLEITGESQCHGDEKRITPGVSLSCPEDQSPTDCK